MTALCVDVWSDIACPWCYVGKRRLEAALQRFEQRDHVELVWHAFELDPSAPPEQDESSSYVERLAKKYGCSVERARDMIERMVNIGQSQGLSLDFRAHPPRQHLRRASRVTSCATTRRSGCGQGALAPRLPVGR
jgi:predicted DsbA family dithiol-disulfide isomerase